MSLSKFHPSVVFTSSHLLTRSKPTPSVESLVDDGSSAAARAKRKRAAERARQAAINNLALAYKKVQGLEDLLDVPVDGRWRTDDPRYQEAVAYIKHRNFILALNKVQALLVQRLFEMAKASVAGLGVLCPLRYPLPLPPLTLPSRLQTSNLDMGASQVPKSSHPDRYRQVQRARGSNGSPCSSDPVEGRHGHSIHRRFRHSSAAVQRSHFSTTRRALDAAGQSRGYEQALQDSSSSRRAGTM